jgi:hypothetical protein
MSDQVNSQTMFSRLSKESHISTIKYEIQMLRFSLDWLTRNGTAYQPEEELYAILECFLLHYRNLVNFLSGKGGSSGDLSMAAPNHWADRDCGRIEIEAIQKLASHIYTAHSAAISTYLAHCTRQRYEQSKRWQPGTMYDELLPAITKFEELFCGEKQKVHATSVLGDADYGTTSMTKYSVLTPPEKILFIRTSEKDGGGKG